MQKKIETLLFEATMFGENAFMAKGGIQMAPGDQFPVNNNNIPSVAKPFPGQYVTLTRVGQAVEKSPNFVLKGYDMNDCAYGTLYANGEEAKWRCDGKIVYTTLNTDDDEDFFSQQEIYRLFLYPFVAWYENKNPEIAGFRELYQKRQATNDDCIRFSVAFQYGFAKNNPDVEVRVACAESLCEPAVDRNVVVNTSGNTRVIGSGLPWQRASGGPAPLNVDSAMAGCFNLAGNWGVVSEGSHTYNFAADMISPSELEGYVDNKEFHHCLEQMTGYIGSLFRRNKLTWDGTPINEFLERHNIAMTGSNQQNFILAGDPGSGKTLMCRMLAASFGLPCMIIRLGERSEQDEMTQIVTATDHGFDSIKSRMYWYVKHGGIIVFDDLSNADPNTFFSTTGGLWESPYEYTVNQETVKRHPMCIMMATTNVGTVGSQPINDAQLTRFGGTFVVNRLADEEFKACIIGRAQQNSGVTVTGKTQKTITDWTFNVFNSVSKAVKTVDRETADRLITMRAAISTAEKILNAIADGYPADCKRFAIETMANILYTGGNPTLQKCVSDAIDSAPSITV